MTIKNRIQMALSERSYAKRYKELAVRKLTARNRIESVCVDAALTALEGECKRDMRDGKISAKFFYKYFEIDH